MSTESIPQPVRVIKSERVTLPRQAKPSTPAGPSATSKAVAVAGRGAVVVGKGVARGAATTGRQAGNVVRGLATAPREIRAWLLVTELDGQVGALQANDPAKAAALQIKQMDLQAERRGRVKSWLRDILGWCPPFLTGGFAPATLAFLLLTIGAAKLATERSTKTGDGAKAKIEKKPPLLSAGAAGRVAAWTLISAGLTGLDGLLLAVFGGGGFRAVLSGLFTWSPFFTVYAMTPLLGAVAWAVHWGINASEDDGTIGDDLRAGEAASAGPTPEQRRDRPMVVEAVLATKRLPADTEPGLLPPGVTYSSDRSIWRATVDTYGPSATVLLEPKARAELAARLGLSLQRMIATVDKDCGSQLHITGIVGKAWKTTRSPLMTTMAPVSLWEGVEWGTTVDGRPINYRIFERNSLFGGEAGSGKSTAMAGIWTAFALSPSSKIYVIDGGEVDTRPLADFGLASAWTTELGEAIRILTVVRDEVNRRQKLLGDAHLRKASPAWFDDNGFSFDLMLIDEVATFTQRKGEDAADATTFTQLMREIAQRCRKVGVHLLLGTQSPSVDAIDADARDVLPVRWLGRARSVDLGNKVLGKGAAGRGLSPATLPDDEETRGVGWYSAPGMEVQVRPHDWTDDDLAAICRRGVELRRTGRPATAADEDMLLALRIAELIRLEGVKTSAGQAMLASDIAKRLDMDQMAIRAALTRISIGTQKVWRPDDPKAANRAHYVLGDFPVSRAI